MAVIFFLSFEVEPKGESSNWAEFGGGQFNCWIRADNATIARSRALEVIASDGWVTKREDECRTVPEGYYDEESSGLRYYKEALRDGEAFVVHTWPPGRAEDDTVH